MVYAFAGALPTTAEEDDEFMKKYESRGTRVTVTASGTQRVDLPLINDPALVTQDITNATAAPIQVTGRIQRSADIPIIPAETLVGTPQRGARGAFRARGARGAAPAPPRRTTAIRSRTCSSLLPPAVSSLTRVAAPSIPNPSNRISRSIRRRPNSAANPLLSFLMEVGGGNIVYDKPFAERVFRRGQELDPRNGEWAARLGQLYSLGAVDPGARLALTPGESYAKSLVEYEKAFALGVVRVLPDMAESARRAGVPDKAADYANRAIATGEPDHVHQGNSTLGHIALEKNSIADAKKYLLASAEVRRSGVLGSFGPNMSLANELLRRGEREAVVAYLERCLAFASSQDAAIKNAIAAIKAGGTPALR